MDLLKHVIKLDDALDVFAVHGVGGIWGALATGLFYGAYTQRSISARERAQAEQKAYSHKESLIRQAKAEWARQHPQEQPKAASGGT